MTHVILDCDDVLLDWLGGFRFWLADRIENVPADPPSTWSLATWLGVSDDRCHRLVAEFNDSWFFGRLGPMPGAVDAVTALRDRGCTLTVLTSCSHEPSVAKHRLENLDAIFDRSFDRVVCLGLGESKAKWLSALRHGIWVEDNYKNALHGLTAGHRTYMVRRSHNRADEIQSNPEITWIDDLRSDFHF